MLLFRLPLGGLAIPEFFCDFAVQLIQIRLIEPVTHGAQSPLKAFRLFLPNRFCAAFIGEQGFFELKEHFIGNVDVAQCDRESVSKLFFAEVGKIAFAAIAGAVVIGVAILLEFCRHCAVVVGAMQQPGKGEFALAIFGFVATAKYSLHLLPQVGSDERPLRAVVELVFPNELAFVEGILEQSFEIALGKKLAEFIFQNLLHAGE